MTFMDLPSGTYKFMVKVANNDGVWSDNPCFINLHIEAPFGKRHQLKSFIPFYSYFLLVCFCLDTLKSKVKGVNVRKRIWN